MDFLLDKVSGLLEKFGSAIPPLTIPWEKFGQSFDLVTPYLAKANILFPVDTALTILALRGAVAAVLLAIWVITFIRKMLPF